MTKLKLWLKENVLYIAWLQAVVAMGGSLYFSEILQFPPCVLCWYQRIAMYPLVAILLVGIIKKDKNIAWYVMPLAIAGLLIAVFNNLIYYKFIPDVLAPCVNGVSCTTKYVEFFGFVTIPFLSLLSFILVIACVLYYHVTHKTTAHEKRN